MKIIIYMSILTTAFTLLGCKSKEEKYLTKHQIIFYGTPEFKDFQDVAKIKVEEAWDIEFDYSKKNNVKFQSKMFFVINKYYVFNNFFQPKIPQSITSGIWVNSETGDVKDVKDGIYLKANNYYQKTIDKQ